MPGGCVAPPGKTGGPALLLRAGYVDLRLRRSVDSGKSWGAATLVHGNSSETEWTTVGDANFVEDETSGVIWMLHARNNSGLFLSHSDDVGVSWSSPLAVGGLQHSPGGAGTGHAGGIQLSSGPHKGRLLIPIYSGGCYVVYSGDYRTRWRLARSVPRAHTPTLSNSRPLSTLPHRRQTTTASRGTWAA